MRHTINCAVCSQPLTLTTDTCSDDNGNPIHKQCYVKLAALNRKKPAAISGSLDLLVVSMG